MSTTAGIPCHSGTVGAAPVSGAYPPAPRLARRIVKAHARGLAEGEAEALRAAVADVRALRAAFDAASERAHAEPGFIARMQALAEGALSGGPDDDPCDVFAYLLDAAAKIEDAIRAAPVRSVVALWAKAEMVAESMTHGDHAGDRALLAELARGLDRLARTLPDLALPVLDE